MRVTHIITRLILGGAQENTVASVLALRTKPHLEVDLISGPTAGPEGSLESSFANAPGVLTLPAWQRRGFMGLIIGGIVVFAVRSILLAIRLTGPPGR